MAELVLTSLPQRSRSEMIEAGAKAAMAALGADYDMLEETDDDGALDRFTLRIMVKAVLAEAGALPGHE